MPVAVVASPWAELLGWLVVPALLLVTASGVGLLLERALRVRLPGTLIAPLGACASIVLLMPGYSLGAGSWLGAPLLLLVAAAGLWPVRRGLRAEVARLFPPWAGAAAAGVYLVYMSPVLLSGDWTWTGYNFVNDTAFQLLLTDWVAHHGVPWHEEPLSTTTGTIREYLRGRYPLGTHAHMATLGAIARTPPELFYQSYISGLTAFTALGLATLGRQAGLSARAAAAAAFVAGCASLTYQYALQGNVKEMALLLAVVTAAAAGRELLVSDRPRAAVVLVALPLAAILDVFGAAGGPYIATVAVVLFAAVWWEAHAGRVRRQLISTVAIGAAVFAVAALPPLTDLAISVRTLNDTFATQNAASNGETLAQLARPLPPYQAGGVWLTGDYRFPVVQPTASRVTGAGLVIVAVLGAAGLALALRRRRTAPALVLGATLIAYLAVAPRVSPYADGKMLAVLSPAVVFCAMVGASVLPGRLRRAGVVAGAVVGVLVMGSAAFAYHDVRLAPEPRIASIAALGDRYAGDDQLMLWTEYEEFAKYFMRRARINVPTEALTEAHIQLKRGLGFFGGRTFDLDDIDPTFVQKYPRIALRIRPNESRPPANYALERRNRYYQVWRQDPSTQVLLHLSLFDDRRRVSLARPDCRELAGIAGQARESGSDLVAAIQPERRTLVLPDIKARPPGWIDDGERPGHLFLGAPGRMTGTVTVRGGRYAAWLQGSLARPVELRVDGRKVGAAQGVNTPDAWLRAAELRLSPGRHRIEVVRRGGTLKPGDGARSSLGAVAFVAPGDARLERVRPSQYRRFCGRLLDWVEIVHRA